jgi:hypothetical protein
MYKGKSQADPFNLKHCEKMKGAKRLSEQPKASRSVAGAEAPSGSRGARPSASRNVAGSNIQGGTGSTGRKSYNRGGID